MIAFRTSKRQRRRERAAERIPEFAEQLVEKVRSGLPLEVKDVWLLYLEHCQFQGCPKSMPRKKQVLRTIWVTGYEQLGEVQLLEALASIELSRDNTVLMAAELFRRTAEKAETDARQATTPSLRSTVSYPRTREYALR